MYLSVKAYVGVQKWHIRPSPKHFQSRTKTKNNQVNYKKLMEQVKVSYKIGNFITVYYTTKATPVLQLSFPRLLIFSHTWQRLTQLFASKLQFFSYLSHAY